MGTDRYGDHFCDKCHTKISEERGYYRCAVCTEKGPGLCARCATLHIRFKHPSFWLKTVVPMLKKEELK